MEQQFRKSMMVEETNGNSLQFVLLEEIKKVNVVMRDHNGDTVSLEFDRDDLLGILSKATLFMMDR